jgi:asparagine synthase (glutamine-hydrolysing)
MCGICGIVERDRSQPVDAAALDRMTDVLEHRGPDGRGVAVFANVGLGNRRLAIIDREGGDQPMRSADGRLTITYNGELYNYLELRADLLARGYVLRTHSDTEVLLGLYAVHGLDMFRHTNGMFAFAIWDSERRRLLLGRDRFGEKPLYWHADAERIVFASEIKSILAAGVRAEPDWGAVQEYLTFQYCLGERTLFGGVRKLPPASYLVLSETGDLLEQAEYWSLGFDEDHVTSERQYIDELRFLLEDAVKIRLRSDVPVGTYLSGGLDSSAVSAVAAKLMTRGLPAFSGAFDEGEAYDELRYARAVAEQNDSELYVVQPTAEDFAASMRRIIWHMDEPAAGPGAFPQLMVSDLAAARVRVVLGGQGGDEIFGGYARYLMMYLEESIKGSIFESQDPARHVVTLGGVLPHLSMLQAYVPLLKRFWARGLFDSMEQRYYALVNRDPDLLAHFTPEFLAGRDESALYEAFELQFNDILHKVPSGGSALFNRMTAYDTRTLLQSLLHVEDRMSMAASLESRLPLLDHRIAELVFRMPPLYKFRDGRSKAALRAAATSIVPNEVLERKDKMGFPVPFVEWARGALRPFIRETLLGESARARGIYNLAGIARLIDGESRYGRELWGLLCLEMWFQVFIDP